MYLRACLCALLPARSSERRELDRLFGKDDRLAKKCREFSQFIDKLDEESMPSGEPEQPEDEMQRGSGAGTGQGENSRAEEANFDLSFTIQIQTSLLEASLEDLAKALAPLQLPVFRRYVQNVFRFPQAGFWTARPHFRTGHSRTS
jgi:hypothetical protein